MVFGKPEDRIQQRGPSGQGNRVSLHPIRYITNKQTIIQSGISNSNFNRSQKTKIENNNRKQKLGKPDWIMEQNMNETILERLIIYITHLYFSYSFLGYIELPYSLLGLILGLGLRLGLPDWNIGLDNILSKNSHTQQSNPVYQIGNYNWSQNTIFRLNQNTIVEYNTQENNRIQYLRYNNRIQ